MTFYIFKNSTALTSGMISGAFLIIAGFYGPQASAQTSTLQTGVEDCQILVDPSERLKCYDNLFGIVNSESSTNLPVTSQPIRPTTPIATPTIAPRPAPVITSESPVAKAEISEAPAPKLTDTNRLTQSVEDFREARLPEASKNVVRSITSEILKTSTHGYRKLKFHLKNGQVWEQIDSGYVKEPKISSKRTFTAEIRKGAISSFYLHINGKGRAIKVRRVR